MLESMPEFVKGDRRVVIEWQNGITQIIGYTNEQPPDVIPTDSEPVSLVKCTPRAYIYHQTAKPEGLGTFDRRQQ